MSEETIIKRFKKEFSPKALRRVETEHDIDLSQALTEQFLIFLMEVLSGRRLEVARLAKKKSGAEIKELRDVLLAMLMQHGLVKEYEKYLEINANNLDSSIQAAELLLRLGVFYEGDGKLYKMRKGVNF